MNNSINKQINKIDDNKESRFINCLSSAYNALGHVSRFSRWLNIAGLSVFFLMMCLTFIDVIMRYVFNSPFLGTKEYTEVMLVLLIAFTIAYTYDQDKQVGMDMMTSRLKNNANLILETIVNILSIGLFILVVWRCMAQLAFFVEMGHMHGTSVKIYAAPFEAGMVIGTATLLLLIIRKFIRNIIDGIKLHFSAFSWLLVFGISIILLVCAFIWMQPGLIGTGLSMPVIALIGLILMVVLMLLGMPISFTLMLSGFLMISHIRGITAALNVLGTEIFTTSSNYLWSVAAFFVLMGNFCLLSGFGTDIYVTFNKWFGHRKGGLAIATIAASTAMAGVVGDALSVTTTMGTIAYPEMKKYKYSDKLSLGTIAAGATLGPIIPPSLGFIIYGVITGESIGKMFIGGIGPGLLLAFFFILTIKLQCRFDIKAGPAGPKISWKEKIISSKYGAPVIALFLVVIGGIYAGIFTAVEGGAIGCAGSLILALIMKRMTWKKFIESLVMTGKITGMVFLIIIGAMMFSRFVAWCNLSGVLLNLLIDLHLSPKLLLVFIFFLFFILGFAIDIVPMLLIGAPVCHPIAVALGADPIWFGVLFVLVVQAGELTPPMSTILFTIKGMIDGVSINTVFNAVIPFTIATVLGVIIMFIIPQVVTWLPNLLY